VDRARGVDPDLVDSGELVSVKPGFSVPLSDQNSVALKTLRSWQVAMPMPTQRPWARASSRIFCHFGSSAMRSASSSTAG